MLDSNATISVVSLFVMCVPGAWFIIRVLRPRFTRWRARREHRSRAVQSLPLHHPRSIAVELPILGSSNHPVHMSTMPSSATFLSVSLADPHFLPTTCAGCSNSCCHFSRIEWRFIGRTFIITMPLSVARVSQCEKIKCARGMKHACGLAC